MKAEDMDGTQVVSLDGLSAVLTAGFIRVVMDDDRTKVDHHSAFCFVSFPPDHDFEVVGYKAPYVPSAEVLTERKHRKRKGFVTAFIPLGIVIMAYAVLAIVLLIHAH